MAAGASTRRARAWSPIPATALMSVLVLLAACASAGTKPTKALRSVAAASAGIPRGSQYVALGSSFAAGPRIPPNQGGRCLRSNSNYAHLVATALGLRLVDVSCSGALAAGLGVAGPGTTPSQLSAVTRATRLVTVTVGGNDIGYAASLVACGAAAALDRSCLTGGTLLRKSEQELVTLKHTLVTLLGKIQAAAPEAQIYVLSYLAILPASGVPCPPNVPFLAADDVALTGLGLQLRNTVSAAASAAKVHFVDAYTAGLSHTACAPPTSRWVEGAKRVLPAFQYHPNSRGMAAVAKLLLTAIPHGS